MILERRKSNSFLPVLGLVSSVCINIILLTLIVLDKSQMARNPWRFTPSRNYIRLI
ncbi:hypothetical protein SCBWM1_gp32 [Synechococcus phage S-CBWM1]|uniref:Uncharacterized protein n=1 Tax=Synechococcus phage S-CBWM1 TaxID=2053653 RepID=A0A3G1L3F9_9CAUD|nr:hypothetical protein HOU61_gp165 [Synechococcus phage S-CBWM1]ATW62716.1 hypothetical protein SCBWM1_gp32 [Synechococcus phage S-CBWM1]